MHILFRSFEKKILAKFSTSVQKVFELKSSNSGGSLAGKFKLIGEEWDSKWLRFSCKYKRQNWGAIKSKVVEPSKLIYLENGAKVHLKDTCELKDPEKIKYTRP